MCISAKVSLNVFSIGVILLLLLNILGNSQYKTHNLYLSFIFIFVILMQIVDYLIWKDIECKNGFNKIAGIIGVLLNYLLPLIAYISFNYFMKVKNNRYNKLLLSLNIIYAVFLVYFLYNYYTKEKLCSTLVKGNISWSWYNTPLSPILNIFYCILLILNLLQGNNIYILIAVIIIYVYLGIVMKLKQGVVGEFWCLGAPFLLIILLFCQHLLPNLKNLKLL